MLTWGLIAAGEIAYVYANAVRFSQTGRLGAVASRSPERGARLAKDFGIPTVYDSYEALLADKTIDAVYISTLHPTHMEWSIKAAEAGKHVLVEKPIAMNAAEADAMIDAAKVNDVFLMEAFMYRCHPQTHRMVELIRDGAVGRVRVIRATFSFLGNGDMTARWYAKELGGGGILDVGGYPASMVRLLAGASAQQAFAEPVSFQAVGVLGPTGVDHYTAAVAKFENDVIAEMICGMGVQMPSGVCVYGEEGMLTLHDPWTPCSPARFVHDPVPAGTSIPPGKILLQPRGKAAQEIEVPVDRDLYAYEADEVAANIGKRQSPAMSWQDSLGNMRLLDRWRQAIGVEYAQDKELRDGERSA